MFSGAAASSAPKASAAEAERPLFAGIDIGGTSIKLGVVDNQGRTLAYDAIVTEEEKGPYDAVGRIGARLEEMLVSLGLSLTDLAAAGLGTPGTHDLPKGMMLAPPNMPHWANTPIREIVSQRLGLRTIYTNDANAAAYGEFWIGSGKEHQSMVMITLGTGVGGGIILGDMTLDGAHSHGGEIGHIPIDYHDSARPCTCGSRGHLEAYASATSLVKRTVEALATGAHSSLREHIETGQALSGLIIAQHAEQGDDLANALIQETAMFIAVGCVIVMHMINPESIVLGGAMNFGRHDRQLGRTFLHHVREEARRRAFPAPGARTVIDYARLGGTAGYIGAAGVARVALLREQGKTSV